MANDAGKVVWGKIVKVHEFHARKFLSRTVENGKPFEVFNHRSIKIFATFLETNTQNIMEDEFTRMEE